jgi:hypothetical protein
MTPGRNGMFYTFSFNFHFNFLHPLYSPQLSIARRRSFRCLLCCCFRRRPTLLSLSASDVHLKRKKIKKRRRKKRKKRRKKRKKKIILNKLISKLFSSHFSYINSAAPADKNVKLRSNFTFLSLNAKIQLNLCKIWA